jgi:hypothetical protein
MEQSQARSGLNQENVSAKEVLVWDSVTKN